ncbi:MAG: hypothetical protein ACI835_000315 [Planctomycetota bacterium]|jgi:hypothetical protein
MSSDARPELIGHAETLRRLWQSASDGRLAHALLFRGARGIGKFLAMQEFAWGLFCQHGPGAPCRTCPPCKRLASGNHADLSLSDVAADGEEQLKVERIVLRPESKWKGTPIDIFLHLKAMDGGWRIVIMRDAHRMTESAQNAFLKTLEEPTPSTLLLLETSEPEHLLPTLRSRLIDVLMDPLTGEQVEQVLAREGVAPEELPALVRWSRGSPGRALEDLGRGLPLMRAILVSGLEGQGTPGELSRALFEASGKFPGKTPAAQTRVRVRSILELGLDMLADGLRASQGLSTASLTHGDIADRFARPGLAAALPTVIDAWLDLRRDIDLNLNPEATLHRALGQFMPVLREPSAP